LIITNATRIVFRLYVYHKSDHELAIASIPLTARRDNNRDHEISHWICSNPPPKKSQTIFGHWANSNDATI